MGFFGCGTFFPGKSLFSFRMLGPSSNLSCLVMMYNCGVSTWDWPWNIIPISIPRPRFDSSTQKVANSTGSVVKLQISFHFQPYLQKWSNLTFAYLSKKRANHQNKFRFEFPFRFLASLADANCLVFVVLRSSFVSWGSCPGLPSLPIICSVFF